MAADHIYKHHAKKEYSRCRNRGFQCEGSSDFHGFSVNMKPIPGLVCISLTGNALFIFLQR